MAQQPDKTTLGDRLSTGAVQAGVWGSGSLLTTTATNGFFKLLSKTPKDHKWISKLDWRIAGVVAAIAVLIKFFTTNGPRERAQSKALEGTINYIADPNNHLSKQQKQQIMEKAITDVQNGNTPTLPTSTKYRDMVTAQRAAASQSQEMGA